MARHLAAALALLLAAEPAITSTPSPYAEFADRSIRALSETQREELLAGRGMGLALAAELNGWPGPAHVLELAPQRRDPVRHGARGALRRFAARRVGGNRERVRDVLERRVAFARGLEQCDGARRCGRRSGGRRRGARHAPGE